MKNTKPLMFLVAATLMMGANGIATSADKKPKFDLGKFEYQNSCAVCHGADGKGGGWSVENLKKAPTDLTTLAKKNNGVFPYDRTYAVIDGRELVKGHGERDMPTWGDRYSVASRDASEYFFDKPHGAPFEMEMYVRSRILALIDYLNRLQVK